MKDLLLSVFAICALVFLELMAMKHRINGKILALVVMVIAGIGGYDIAKYYYLRKKNSKGAT